MKGRTRIYGGFGSLTAIFESINERLSFKQNGYREIFRL